MVIFRHYELTYKQIFLNGEGEKRTKITKPNIFYLISKFDQSRTRGEYVEGKDYTSETLIQHFLSIDGFVFPNDEHHAISNIELPLIQHFNLTDFLKEKDIFLKNRTEEQSLDDKLE